MKKKRIVSIAVAVVLILALGGATVYGFVEAERYKRDLQYGYKRSLSNLQGSVNNIETTLKKSAYANTATEQNGLAAKLMRESSSAQAALSVLPLTEDSIDNVSKFVTQVGDFSMSLSKQIAQGKKITEDEYKTIETLTKYAQTLQKDMESAKPDFSQVQFNDTRRETVKDFNDFPSLIYDGPFSDNINQKKPLMTEGKDQILQGNAQNIAADFLGVSQSKLTHTADTAGSLPTYNFTANNEKIRICVTKAGGFISNMSNSRQIGEPNLDYKACSQKALAFLKSRGIQNMKESYYIINDGMCLINYAHMYDNVLCYPDLIKIGVALDDGSIVRFESTGYIMNHKTRSFSPKLSRHGAQKSVSSNLTVKQARLALIPTPGLNEVLCWEFLCSGREDDRVLVYINADTGFEEDILIIVESDAGVLTK